MVATYTIAGRQVGSHVVRPRSSLEHSADKKGLGLYGYRTDNAQLAMATLGVLFGGSWAATRGGSKAPQSTPPINAGSKDEEKFIQFGRSILNV